MQMFGSPAEDVGYFCMWRKDSSFTAGSGSCAGAEPYADELADVTSIDGTVTSVCTLAMSTCLALTDIGKPCGDAGPMGAEGVAHSELCGFSHSNETFENGSNVDAYCVDVGVGGAPNLVCAPVCLNNGGNTQGCDSSLVCATTSGHEVCVAP